MKLTTILLCYLFILSPALRHQLLQQRLQKLEARKHVAAAAVFAALGRGRAKVLDEVAAHERRADVGLMREEEHRLVRGAAQAHRAVAGLRQRVPGANRGT